LLKHSRILTFTATAGLLLLAIILPSAHAYGNTAQWQIGFSGNCKDPTACGQVAGTESLLFGFWGWCEFGGSSGSTASDTTGTSGDCQVTIYSRTSLGQPINPTHLSIDVTGWTIMSSPESPTGTSFHITASTLECTGPGAKLPPGPFSGCALPPGGDTGIPPVAGHYSFSPFPGYNINIQVNQLP